MSESELGKKIPVGIVPSVGGLWIKNGMSHYKISLVAEKAVYHLSPKKKCCCFNLARFECLRKAHEKFYSVQKKTLLKFSVNWYLGHKRFFLLCGRMLWDCWKPCKRNL